MDADHVCIDLDFPGPYQGSIRVLGGPYGFGRTSD